MAQNEWGWGWTGENCTCCDGPTPPFNCFILSDDFNRDDAATLGADWNEVAGSWAIDTATAETSSSNAIAVSAADITPAVPYVLYAGIGGVVNSRLIFDYVDSSNYHYLERQAAFTWGQIALVKVTGGSPSTIGTQFLGPGDYASGVLQLRACVKAGVVQLNLGSVNRNLSFSTTLHGGTYAGIGTGSVSGAVEFHTFLFAFHASESHPTCPFCLSDCTNGNCETVPPIDYTIDWGTPGFLSADFCSFCPDFGGLYVLRHRASFASECQWRYNFNTGCNARIQFCSSVQNVLTQTLRIETVFPGFRWRLDVAWGSSVTDPNCGGMIDQFTAIYASEIFEDPIDCQNLDELELAIISSNIATACSGTLPATITMSAA